VYAEACARSPQWWCGGDGERSAVHRARPAGPLRLLCRAAAGARGVRSSLATSAAGWSTATTLALEVTVERGATCVVTTQASTKVYRGPDPSADHCARRRCGHRDRRSRSDRTVPQARGFAQTTSVELAGGAC